MGFGKWVLGTIRLYLGNFLDFFFGCSKLQQGCMLGDHREVHQEGTK